MKKVKVVDKDGNILIPEVSIEELGVLLRKATWRVEESLNDDYDDEGDVIPVVSTEELGQKMKAVAKELIDNKKYITPEEEIREQEKEKRHTIFVIIAMIIIIFATLLL